MKNYIFELKIEIDNLAVIRETVCMLAESKAEAQQGANRLAFDWWGMPSRFDADARVWRAKNDDERDANVSAVPQYRCRASPAKLAFLKRARGKIQQFDALNVTDEYMMFLIQEAQESGMAAIDVSHLTDLFGARVAEMASESEPVAPEVEPPMTAVEVLNTTHTKRYFGKLHERNGEQAYLHHVLFETDSDPTVELLRRARKFYPVEADARDDGFYFYCGSIFVAPATLVEVTEEEYDVLKRFC
jgi:hypothetical protein